MLLGHHCCRDTQIKKKFTLRADCSLKPKKINHNGDIYSNLHRCTKVRAHEKSRNPNHLRTSKNMSIKSIKMSWASNQKINFSTTDSGATSLYQNQQIWEKFTWKCDSSKGSCGRRRGSFRAANQMISTESAELSASTLLRERLENNDITYSPLARSEWRLWGRNSAIGGQFTVKAHQKETKELPQLSVIKESNPPFSQSIDIGGQWKNTRLKVPQAT